MVIFRGRSKYASFSGRNWKEKQQNPVSLLAAVSHRQRAESAGTLWLPQPRQLQPGSAASPGHEDLSWRSDFQIQLHQPTWAYWKEVENSKTTLLGLHVLACYLQSLNLFLSSRVCLSGEGHLIVFTVKINCRLFYVWHLMSHFYVSLRLLS